MLALKEGFSLEISKLSLRSTSNWEKPVERIAKSSNEIGCPVFLLCVSILDNWAREEISLHVYAEMQGGLWREMKAI